jgi:chromatin assembly factor 1 subunit A
MNQSNSAKKLKQSRLPFSPLTSPSGSTTIPVKISEVSSPKTPVVARKRKPSSDPEVLRSNKIGRKSSKENIATEQDVVEIIDSESEQGQSPIIITNETSSEIDGDPLHIKLPFSTKKKTNSDAKQPQKSVEEEEEDDSIVYLDKEDLKSQKKPKKTTKKKKKTTDTEETPIVNVVENEKVDIPEEMEIDITATDEKIPDSHECSPKSFDTIPSTKVSPEKNDDDEQEEFNDEIADVLTDFSEDLNASSVSTKESNPTNTTTSSNFDITKLTPKQLARRQEFENRRLEKERKKQQERELREQQRLKEKEIREDAKRKEREEKEEARRKEKEDRDRKKQAELDKKEQERKQKEEERKKLQDQRDEEKRQKEEERKV